MPAISEKNTRNKGALNLFGSSHIGKAHNKKKKNHSFIAHIPDLRRLIGIPKAKKRKDAPQDSLIPDSLFWDFKRVFSLALNQGFEPYDETGLFSRKYVQIPLHEGDLIDRLEKERIGLVQTYQQLQERLKRKNTLGEKKGQIVVLNELIGKNQELLAKFNKKKSKSKETEVISRTLKYCYSELDKIYAECARESVLPDEEMQSPLPEARQTFTSTLLLDSDYESSDDNLDESYSSYEEASEDEDSVEQHLSPKRRKKSVPRDIQEEPSVIFPKQDQREALEKLSLDKIHNNHAEIFETKFKIAALEAEYDTCLTRKKWHKKAEEKTFVAKTGIITKKLKRFDEKNNISNELRCFYKRLAKLVSKKNKKENNYYKEQEQNYAFASKQLEIKKAALLQAEKGLPKAAEPREKVVIEGEIKVQLKATVTTISYAEQANIHKELAKLYKELADYYRYERECESDEYAQAIEDAAEATLFRDLMTAKATNRADGRYSTLQR